MLIKRALRSLRKNEGITTIEFALLAPIFFLLLIGIIEIGLIMYVSTVLEGATALGARVGKTGFIPEGMTRSEYIEDAVISKTSGLLDPDRIRLRVVPIETWTDSWVEEDDPCPPIPEPCAVDAGGPGDIVLYETSYEWDIFTPMMGKFFGESITISGVTPVRNESF